MYCKKWFGGRRPLVHNFYAMHNQRNARRNFAFQACLCAWVVASQLWYFYRFSPILTVVLKSIARTLWR